MMHVVLYGSPCGGYKIHGPFPDEEAASQWGEDNGEGGEFVMPVHPVTEDSQLYPWPYPYQSIPTCSPSDLADFVPAGEETLVKIGEAYWRVVPDVNLFGADFETWRARGFYVEDLRDHADETQLYPQDEPDPVPGFIYESGWFKVIAHQGRVQYHVFLGSPIFDRIVPTKDAAERLLWEHYARGVLRGEG